MLFSSFYFLVSIKPYYRIHMMKSLETSLVNNANTWRFLPVGESPDFCTNDIKQFFYYSFILPFAEVVIHALPGCKALGKHTPLATRFNSIEYSIHNTSKRIFSLSSLRVNDIFYNLLLLISKVG